jgi:hypothetical protein
MAASKDWDRLAEFTRERRVELGLTQEDVRVEGGPSTATMRLIEGALQEGYQPATLRDLEKALQWEHGSVMRILNGGDPVLASAAPEPAPRYRDEDFPDEATVEMAEALEVHKAEVNRAVRRASRRYPGRELTGEMIFGEGTKDATYWNLMVGARFSPIGRIKGLAALKAMDELEAGAEGNDFATGLVRT